MAQEVSHPVELQTRLLILTLKAWTLMLPILTALRQVFLPQSAASSATVVAAWRLPWAQVAPTGDSLLAALATLWASKTMVR